MKIENKLNLDIELIHGDCLEKLKDIESGSIDLVLTDPPYGTIKGIEKGLKTFRDSSWDKIIDTELLFTELNRILRRGGRLILFAQEPYTSHLITYKDSEDLNNLVFNYRMIYKKDSFGNPLTAKKAPVSYFEDILVFTKKYDFNLNNPLREYSKKVFNFINKTKSQIDKDMNGGIADHFFRFNSTQFDLCTEKTYNKLIEFYKIDKMEDFIKYEDLLKIKKEYDENYKVIFNLENGKNHKSNILEYKKDLNGFHPTQKPVALLEDLIYTYSNKGDRVLDFTFGSASTCIAIINKGRNFIGIEKDKKFFDLSVERVTEHLNNQNKKGEINE